MTSCKVPNLVTLLLLFHLPGYSIAFGWWFLWPTTSAASSTTTTGVVSTSSPVVGQSANGLEISLGNRENTSTLFTDGGTNITNVEVNYARAALLLAEEFGPLLGSSFQDESRSIPLAGTFSPDSWIETILDAYYHAANESRRERLEAYGKQLQDLDSYADDVASMLDRIRIAFGIELNRSLLTLDVAVLRCAQGHTLDSFAKRVFEGNRDCIEERLESVRDAQLEANHNISRQLVEWDEDYLRNEIRECSSDNVRWNETDQIRWGENNEHQLACISAILHQVHLKTLLIAHNMQRLTEGANLMFGTAKADLLQCAENLLQLAQDSLGGISRVISDCQTHQASEDNEQPFVS